MNWLDVLLLLPIGIGIFRGITKGFVHEVFSLIGVFAGVILAKLYAHSFAQSFLKAWFDLDLKYAQPIAFILIFIVSAVVAHLLAVLISQILKVMLLDWFNKLLGAIFGCLKYILIMSIILNLFDLVNHKVKFINPSTTEHSFMYKPIKKIVLKVAPQYFYGK
jgi:membrane protein required for colicin V production